MCPDHRTTSDLPRFGSYNYTTCTCITNTYHLQLCGILPVDSRIVVSISNFYSRAQIHTENFYNLPQATTQGAHGDADTRQNGLSFSALT